MRGSTALHKDTSLETHWEPSGGLSPHPRPLGRRSRCLEVTELGEPVSLWSFQVCYLCYSLLTLAGVVVSCQDITPDQWVSIPGG